MQLYNYQTKKSEEVPDDQSAGAIASGVYSPQSKTTLNVISPDGTRGTIAAEDAQDAFANQGFDIETPEMRKEAEDQEKYGSGIANPLKAGALGLARGATFGLSDQSLKRTGLMSSEDLRQYKEQNPLATLAGEVGSVALPSLGSVGKIAGSGVSLAEHAGEAVTGGLEHVIGEGGESLAGHILSKYAPKVLGAGVEGAMYGAGHEISEAALGDYDLTAEKLAAGAGMGFAIAGGSVAGAMLGKAAIKAAIPDSVKEAVANMVTDKTNAIGKFFDPDRNEQLFLGARGKDLDPVVGEKFQDAQHGLLERGFLERGEKTFDVATNKFKPIEGGASHLPTRAESSELINKTIPEIGEHINARLAAADQAVEDGLASRITGGLSETARDTLLERIQKLGENGVADPDKLLGIVGKYETLANAKGGSLVGLQELKKGIYDTLGDRAYVLTAPKPEVAILKDVARDIKETIERGSTAVEKQAGLAQGMAPIKDLNQTMGQLMTVQKPLNRAIGAAEANVNVGGLRFRDLGIGSMGAMVGGTAGGPLGAIAGAGLGVANKLMQSDSGYLLRTEMGKALQQMQLRMIAKITGRVDLDMGAAIDEFALVAGRGAKKVGGRVADKAGEQAFEAQPSALPNAAVRVGFGLKDLQKTPTAGELLSHPLSGAAPVEPKSKDKADLFRARAKELTQMVSDPQVTSHAIVGASDHWKASAPNIADKLTALNQKAIGYAFQAMPKDPLGGSMLNPSLSVWQPSDIEISKWARVLDVLRNPMRIVGSLSTGDISPDQVAAVKEVYPAMYQDLQKKIMQRIAVADEPLPYGKRVQLGQLFDVPTDPTMAPAFTAAMTSLVPAHQAEQAHHEASQGQKSQDAQNAMTLTQRLSAK